MASFSLVAVVSSPIAAVMGDVSIDVFPRRIVRKMAAPPVNSLPSVNTSSDAS